jgi:hypothetical protein
MPQLDVFMMLMPDRMPACQALSQNGPKRRGPTRQFGGTCPSSDGHVGFSISHLPETFCGIRPPVVPTWRTRMRTVHQASARMRNCPPVRFSVGVGCQVRCLWCSFRAKPLVQGDLKWPRCSLRIAVQSDGKLRLYGKVTPEQAFSSFFPVFGSSLFGPVSLIAQI